MRGHQLAAMGTAELTFQLCAVQWSRSIWRTGSTRAPNLYQFAKRNLIHEYPFTLLAMQTAKAID
jgi:hypothetical protein